MHTDYHHLSASYPNRFSGTPQIMALHKYDGIPLELEYCILKLSVDPWKLYITSVG